MKYYHVRTLVINANVHQWDTLHQISVRGVVSLEPEETFESIGFFGRSAAKATDEELEFFSQFADIARKSI